MYNILKQKWKKKQWELSKKLVYKLNLFQFEAQLSVRAKEKFDVKKQRKQTRNGLKTSVIVAGFVRIVLNAAGTKRKSQVTNAR